MAERFATHLVGWRYLHCNYPVTSFMSLSTGMDVCHLARRNLINSYTANDDPWKTSNMPDPLSIAGSAF
ncbi:hypothetical protein FOVSG1_009356 [Fusarium oxysporum f. sp. vasinfectum]